jgi:hypothetical protein
MARQGQCKLCGSSGDLINSHVVPDFYIRNLERQQATGAGGQTQPFSTLMSTRPEVTGGAKQRGHWERQVGLKEYLMCAKCEGKLSVWEVYAREFLYGNAPPPLKKQALGVSYFAGAPPKMDELIDIRMLRGVDHAKLKLFQLSLIWRAGVAQGDFFKEINLGDKHGEIIRDLLDREDPGLVTQYPCAMNDLQYNGNGQEDFIEQPETVRDELGRNIIKFAAGGYLYVTYISSHPAPVEALDVCVKPNGDMKVLVVSAERMLRFWSDALGKAGKL